MSAAVYQKDWISLIKTFMESYDMQELYFKKCRELTKFKAEPKTIE